MVGCWSLVCAALFVAATLRSAMTLAKPIAQATAVIMVATGACGPINMPMPKINMKITIVVIVRATVKNMSTLATLAQLIF